MTRSDPPPRLRPKDAATLILVRESRSGPELLMGQREKNHVFMAGMYVFPGGRVDPDDARVAAAAELDADVAGRLAKSCTPRRARAIALAAIRELYEEAGLILGAPAPMASADALGEPWRSIADRGFSPALAPLEYIARAITPPGRPRRFHARFFMADARHAHGELAGDGELVDLRWVPLAGAKELPTAGITRLILDEVTHRLADPERRRRPIPVFKTRRGRDTAVDYD